MFHTAVQKATRRLAGKYACYASPDRLQGGIEDVQSLLEDRGLRAILERLPRPIGAVCQDDAHAAALVRACSVIGLLVPDDIAVIGVGDTAAGRYTNPRLTSIRLPCEAMGARAMGMLSRLLGQQGQPSASRAAASRRPLLMRVHAGDLIPRESTVGHRASDQAAQHWLAYVHGRADRGANVSQMAAELCVPRRWFERQFTRLVGRAPSEELQRARLDRAMRLLADPMLTVTEVGKMLGFSETASFSRFFRKRAGTSPRDYRRQVLATEAAEQRPPRPGKTGVFWPTG